MKRGDIVGARGFPGRSQRGELSLFPATFAVLAPCLHMVPKRKLENQVGPAAGVQSNPGGDLRGLRSELGLDPCRSVNLRLLDSLVTVPMHKLRWHSRACGVATYHCEANVDIQPGLTRQETRYRQRYLDAIVNPRVREIFHTRARIIQMVRKYYDDRGFLEVGPG